MVLKICKNCGQHIFKTDIHCPHCMSQTKRAKFFGAGISMAVLLGLGVAACGEDEKSDSAESEPSTETSEPSQSEPEPAQEDLYGNPASEDD